MRFAWLFIAVLSCRAASVGPRPSEIEALYPGIEALYIDIHTHPELAFEEKNTAAKLAARIQEGGYQVTTGVGGTGIVGLLRNGEGPVVMLRTELDALPVTEQTGLSFSSKIAGVMHACGHDLHMAAWAGTAQWMAEASQSLARHAHAGRAACRGSRRPVRQRCSKTGSSFDSPSPISRLHFMSDDTLPAGVIGFHAAVSSGPPPTS